MKHIKKFNELNEGWKDKFHKLIGHKSDAFLEQLDKEFPGDRVDMETKTGFIQYSIRLSVGRWAYINIHEDGLVIVDMPNKLYHLDNKTIKTKVSSKESAIKFIKSKIDEEKIDREKVDKSYDDEYND